jgi:hypothetical protein
MGWSPLASQFCLELAFGVLLALAFVPKAPVGVLFYRIMGTAALVPVLAVVGAAFAAGEGGWRSSECLFGALAIVTYPVYSGPVRGKLWAAGLGVALLGTGAGVVALLAESSELGAGRLALGGLSALATGTVAGSVGLAMVLGHWYLTVPNLHVKHLRRLNRVTVVSMAVSLVLVLATCLLGDAPTDATGGSLLRPMGLFHIGSRVTVGLVLPLLFGWMAASSLRYENTRSATGILYASTLLVLIGTFVSITLQDSYGVPL